MKIAMLTNKAGHHTHSRLKQSAERRGHRLDAINPLRCTMAITGQTLTLCHEGRPIPDYDAVVPWLSPSTAEAGMAVLRQLECMGVASLNPSEAVAVARDKFRSLQVLVRGGVAVPATACAHDRVQAAQTVEMVGGAPTVVKLPEGRQGVGVVIAETVQSARSVIEAFRGINQHVLVQRFIEEAAGTDIRVIVIDGKVVGTMLRSGRPGDFRSNLHRGGHAQAVSITPAEHVLALRAASAAGLNLCGVDILRSNDGPLVIEINATPGFKGAEAISGRDIASLVIASLEARLDRPGTKGPELQTIAA